MKLTKEQFDALAPYEKHFDSAVNHRWTRFPGGAALDLIHDTLKQVTGLNLPLNKCCSHCILELMTEMGRIFLADRDEMKDRGSSQRIFDNRIHQGGGEDKTQV